MYKSFSMVELGQYYCKYAIIMYYVTVIEPTLFNRWRLTTTPLKVREFEKYFSCNVNFQWVCNLLIRRQMKTTNLLFNGHILYNVVSLMCLQI